MMRSLCLLLPLLLAWPALAQDKLPPAPPPATDDPDELARQQIEAALDAPLSVSFAGASLQEVLDLLRDLTPLQLALDPAVPDDVTVTFEAQDVSVRQALDGILAGQRLQVRVFSGALVILPTGKDLGVPPQATPGPAGDALTQRRVTLNFPATPWAEVLSFLRDITGLPIEPTPEAQRAIDATEVTLRLRDVSLRHALTLLTHLHGLTWRTDGGTLRLDVRRPARPRVAALPASSDEGPEGPRLTEMSKEEVQRRLQIAVNVGTGDADNLYAIAIELQNQTGVVFRVEGVDKSTTVGFDVEDVPASEILDMLCPSFGARWSIEEGGVVVIRAAAPCGACGEPRGNVSPCPSCGAQ